ncbi:MAG TPA: helix-turn-helix transcriptional regulator [Terriglobales bacterium]|nr:helix-turn-helix transcriptional regulator [Terriglobales bacterium]
MPSKKPRPAGGIGSYIRGQRELANISLRKMAEQSGISATVLQDIESGLRNPSATILTSIARGLRLSAETLYLQAGLIDPRDVGEADLIKEINRDPHLTERQRDILIDLYDCFCAVNRTTRK